MNEHTHKYMVIENIATMIATLIACKFLGMWGLVFLLNLSYPRKAGD